MIFPKILIVRFYNSKIKLLYIEKTNYIEELNTTNLPAKKSVKISDIFSVFVDSKKKSEFKLKFKSKNIISK